jgi:hypothetical protein
LISLTRGIMRPLPLLRMLKDWLNYSLVVSKSRFILRVPQHLPGPCWCSSLTRLMLSSSAPLSFSKFKNDFEKLSRVPHRYVLELGAHFKSKEHKDKIIDSLCFFSQSLFFELTVARHSKFLRYTCPVQCLPCVFHIRPSNVHW